MEEAVLFGQALQEQDILKGKTEQIVQMYSKYLRTLLFNSGSVPARMRQVGNLENETSVECWEPLEAWRLKILS